ncbi:MAG TPA: pilus assembly protein PilP [Rhodanobacteraceae bacterium]|nr:pilus assembly protein PilP [Rhodanobacteraceae bacterium]
MKTTLRWLIPGFALLALAGCSSGHGDLETWVAQQKAKPGPPLPALPVIKTFETFTYKDQDLRDPFASATGKATDESGKVVAKGPRPDPNRVKEPLESFALDSLKMVGTIGSGDSIVALLEDSSGILHQVHDGNYVGKNYGHIIGITEDHINIVELVPNGNGGWRERAATIAMGEQP